MSAAHQTDPEFVDAPAATTAVVFGVVAMSEVPSFFDRTFSTLPAVLATQGVAIVGPAFARYHGPPSDVADLEIGFPTDRPVQTDGDVQPGALPLGRVARLVHHGSYGELGTAWERLGAWIAGRGLTPGDDLWEVYVTEPSPDMDPADLRTELNWSVR